ncbi:putative N-ethylmaleimide-sensitive factor [Leishmania major strain Friedlin]|uniref:Vesicle-fusing ATPase n=1 Tax=Leishmania major TaxID=5664 RepID=Q4QCW5_LEIMA|nr:putative N-ethylmaleimide-sensitive factor [Leishmania major strain Friedlin]CAG9573151.1 vesicular-fusion_protein_nsf_-_putative [Leishmania major strain Friedlin]CAJ03864.1 putative N-ethylmaleimide-sensitive factor [Leishmania major strain Friedlin]|eukprot:XP_001682833.1 putative N-ethylmaleimide-sensitive factor [Leishmania major strain Friedlin]
MSRYYSVCSVPTDNDTKTNCIFLSTVDFAEVAGPQAAATGDSFVVLVQGFPFTVCRSDVVERGAVAMNSIQRRLLGLSTGARSTVVLEPFLSRVPNMRTLQIQVEPISTRQAIMLDCQACIAYMEKMYSGQYFRVTQQLAVVMDTGERMRATVMTTELVESKEVSAASLDIGRFSRGVTQVIITASEASGITLMNVSEAQMDAQQPQLVRNFNLENLGIGGLRAEFGQVFRRAFASRMLKPSFIKKLALKHVKGVLLYGPPGTGKTLIARKIGEILNCHEPKIVNGPEVFNKFVGGTEENIRKLFADAEKEQAEKGDQSRLHLIIFDEFDAICKQRGAVRDSTGVNDNVVNQLLSKIDGVNSLNNVLLVGMTNRRDLIDEAILRPGRFEVHVEIGLPDEPGRVEIFRIHTRGMLENNIMSSDVSLEELGKMTKNYSGAEIEGVVRDATSNAFNRHIDLDHPDRMVDDANVHVTREDFMKAVEEVTPAFGQAKEECANLRRGGIIDYGDSWEVVKSRCRRYTDQLNAAGKRIDSLAVLIDGAPGSGKSAVSAYLAEIADFPYVKVVSAEDMVGYGEMQRVNILRKAFEDAYKSPASCIILDDLERLIDFSQLGGRYSNTLLQALLVLIKRPPPEGKKLLVVGTTAQYDIMDSLELGACFSVKLHLPSVPVSAIPKVCEGLGLAFASQQDMDSCLSLMSHDIPMKQLMLLLEMASEQKGSGRPLITYQSMSRAKESVGGY